MHLFGGHYLAYHTLEKEVLSEACPHFGNMTRLVDTGKSCRHNASGFIVKLHLLKCAMTR